MKNLFFIILFLIGSYSSRASEFKWAYYDQSKNIYYLLAFPEKGIWRLAHFVVKKDRLQEKLKEYSFRSLPELRSFLRKEFPQLTTDKLLSLVKPLAVTELKDQGQVIWHATNNWNEDWENKYSIWVENNFTKTFFQEYQLATDCADVAYAIRWIFARINSLPMANTLSGSEVIFSNESMKVEWGDLPVDEIWYKDRRFLAGLNYLLENTYTHQLFKDSYPLAIDGRFISAGSFFLSLFEEYGHTQVIARTNFYDSSTAPIVILSSTVPREVRVLAEQTFNQYSTPIINQIADVKLIFPKTYQ